MRTLSIRQPWAWLIVNGHKPVENRDWSTEFRGQFLVHASLTLTKKEYRSIAAQVFERFAIVLPAMEALERGGVVGVVDLVECEGPQDMIDYGETHQAWYTGAHAFVLANARPLPFFPVKGQLGWFDVRGVPL